MSDTPQIGSNIDGLKADIKAAYEAITQKKADRDATTKDIAALRADLEAKGIPKEAFDFVCRYLDWDEDKREQFDVGMVLVREALGVPIQASLLN